MFGSTSNGDLLVSFSVFEDASFDGGVIIHVNSFNEESSKSSPEDGETGGAEDAKWSNTVLEVEISLGMLDIVVVLPFSWFSTVGEQSSGSNDFVGGGSSKSFIHTCI